MHESSRILFNRAERYICIWRVQRRPHGAYCWITPSSMARINDLLDSGVLDGFTVVIEQPPAMPVERYPFLAWVGKAVTA